MSNAQVKLLTPADRVEIFRIATRSLVHFHGKKLDAGMNDTDLEHALKQSLGVFGGSGGPDRLSVSFTGAGLRIWGGWHTVNHCEEKPIFSGVTTIAMAREVYGIENPDDDQLALF